MCHPTEGSTRELWEGERAEAEKEGVIRFVAYNIWNGQNGGLESDLQGMAKININPIGVQ